ncbi:DNA-directed RNA polymerase subunit beta [Candidatus Vidania fulgoroideorum]
MNNILFCNNKKIFFNEQKIFFNVFLNQKKSFLNYIFNNFKNNDYGIRNFLVSYFPIISKNKFIKLNFINFNFIKKDLFYLCNKRNKSFCYNFYFRFSISIIRNNIKKESLFNTFYLFKFPFMNKKGNYLINGINRVIISQFCRTSGIFLEKKKNSFIIKIIPVKGNWFYFLIDRNKNIFFKIDNKKIPIFYLINFLNLDTKYILNNINSYISIKLKNGLILSKIKSKIIGKRSNFSYYYKKKKIINKGEIINKKDINTYLNKYLEVKQKSFIIYKSFYIKNIKFRKNTRLNPLKVFSLLKNKSKIIFVFSNKNNNIIDVILKNFFYNRKIFYFYKKYNNILFKIFKNNNYFNISNEGRNMFSKKIFPISISKNINKFDIVKIIKKLITNIKFNDDIDNLSNKKIRGNGELLENVFKNIFIKIKNNLSNKLINFRFRNFLKKFFNYKYINSLIKEFFCTSQLSQFLDQTNVLSELTHKRRISSLGPQGLTKDRAGFKIRDVHFSYYGKICPIETPEGVNIGLVNSLTYSSFVDKFGFIRTPYFKIKNNIINYNKIVYLSSIDEINKKIYKANAIKKKYILCRLNNKLKLTHSNKLELIDIGFLHVFSIASSLIPFLEFNELNRALMGANMQRQSIYCIIKQAPFIKTGIEDIIIKNSFYCIFFKKLGKIIFSNNYYIIIKMFNYFFNMIVLYIKNIKLNQDILLQYNFNYKQSILLKKRNLLCDSSNTIDGNLCLGQNILVAFLPFKGFNFEDSIIVSSKLIEKNYFSSVHVKKFIFLIKKNEFGKEIITKNNQFLDKKDLIKLNSFGIIKIGCYVKKGDILVSKLIPINTNKIMPEEKLIHAIFNNKNSSFKNKSIKMNENYNGFISSIKIIEKKNSFYFKNNNIIIDNNNTKYKQYILLYIREAFFYIKNIQILHKCKCIIYIKKYFLYYKKVCKCNLSIFLNKINKKISIIKTNFFKKKKNYLPFNIEKKIIISIISIRNLSIGDKMSGRHGNKGVVSKIIKSSNMPYLKNGTICDIILNPLSIHSRMNLGQLYEIHMGYIIFGFKKKVLFLNKKKRLLFIFIRKFFFTLNMFKIYKNILLLKNKDYKKISFTCPNFNCLFKYKINILLNLIFDNKFSKNIGVNFKNKKISIYDGFSCNKIPNIVIGYMYFMKLNHLVDDKIHSRSVGPYSLITQQPLKGKSNFGGQRMGEMEIWALEAYGAAFTIQEMLTVKSDDIIGRKKTYENLINLKNKIECFIPESFKNLEKELRALGIDVHLK